MELTDEEQWQDWTMVAARSVVDRVERFEELNAESEEEGNEVFNKMARKVWTEVAVHGFLAKDSVTGEIGLLTQTDLDGKCALAMLRRAGVKFEDKDIKYVEPSCVARGAFNVDTGRKNGVVYEDETLIVDHHAMESGRDTSATKFVYELMVRLGLMERDLALDKLVAFETQMDNWAYPKGNQREFFLESYKNMVGLSRYISFESLFAFFEEGGDPEDELSEAQIERFGLTGKREEMKKKIEDSIASIARIEARGETFETEGHGKIVINVNGEVPLGFEACRALGYGGCLYWYPEDDGYMLVTREHLSGDEVTRFAEETNAINLRKRILMKPRWRRGELKTDLTEMVEKMKEML